MIYWHVIIVAVISGIIWRLGGGAFTSITGLNFGTDAARVLRALVAGALPGVCLWWFDLDVPALFIGVCLGGWGPFQGMGEAGTAAPENSWKRWLPERLGFAPGTLAHDFIGMMQAGLCCMAPLALLFAWFDWRVACLLLACGLGFAPCYLAARLPLPVIPKFAAGGEWGEVFTGALLGAAFVMIAQCAGTSWRIL